MKEGYKRLNVFKKVIVGTALLVVFVTGCATVPMAPKDQDVSLKKFKKPSKNMAALYIYRNSFVGQALKKNIYIDGAFLGESANKVYFYKEVTPGQHQLSTESEFSDNSISFMAKSGNNFFAEQYIKMGVFVGGANVKMVTEEEGMKNVLECNLAQSEETQKLQMVKEVDVHLVEAKRHDETTTDGFELMERMPARGDDFVARCKKCKSTTAYYPSMAGLNVRCSRCNEARTLPD